MTVSRKELSERSLTLEELKLAREAAAQWKLGDMGLFYWDTNHNP